MTTSWFRFAGGVAKGDKGDPGASYATTSTTTITIAAPLNKVFTISGSVPSTYAVGTRLRAASAGNPDKFAEGVITGVSGADVSLLVDTASDGGGTYSDWNLGLAGQPGKDGSDGQDGQPGQTGQPGQPGQNGPPGQNGQDGRTGQDGPPGQQGEPGIQGPPGPQNPWGIEIVSEENSPYVMEITRPRVLVFGHGVNSLSVRTPSAIEAPGLLYCEWEVMDADGSAADFPITVGVATGDQLNGVVNGSVTIASAFGRRRVFAVNAGDFVISNTW